jgi:hypothetical protein
MRIEIAESISLYFKSIRNDYPDLTFEQVKEIAMGPWVFTKHIFESGVIDTIRLKYFGVFKVPPTRAKRLLREAKYRFDNKYITPKQYFKIKASIENYLKNIEDEEAEADTE